MNEVAANKKHDESLKDSIGLDKDNVFVQGLKSLEGVNVLLNCLQNLKTEIKNVNEISIAAREWQIKDTEQLIEMNSAIALIHEKFGEFEKEIIIIKKQRHFIYLSFLFNTLFAVD